jgi:filamentous hemagglutinin family protein
MTQSWRSRCWKFTLASAFFIGGALASLGDGAKAQIVPDQTLPVNSKVSALAGCSIVCFISIENGTQVGNNLFHSFKQFSVGPDDIASFKSDPGIVNIISRVTGSSVSNINGLVTAEGSRANLFLINPNGIILGPNAALDIGGSFVATTANAIEFGNQGFFSASAANVPPPTLTVNPSALLFNQIANQSINSIQVNKAILSVRDAQSLLLVGTDVRLDGGKLLASGGRVELGGLAGQGKVGLQFTDNNFSLSYPNSVARADVSLTNQAVVAVEAGGGGSIAINARNIDVLGESLLSAGIYKGLGSPGSQAGDITLNATGKITIENSQIYNAVDKRAVGNGGNINITADSLTVADVPLLSAETLGQGNAGNISVQVQNSVSVKNSFILNGVRPTGVGNGGNISIRARSVSLTDRGVLSSATNGQGKAGNIELMLLILSTSLVFFQLETIKTPVGCLLTLREKPRIRVVTSESLRMSCAYRMVRF